MKSFEDCIEEDRKWRMTWQGSFMSHVWYPIRRWFLDVFWYHTWYHQGIKAFWQRGRRGWADCDVWSFDHYLAGVIAGGLNSLREKKNGVSSHFMAGLPEDEVDKGFVRQQVAYEKWANALLAYTKDFENTSPWFELSPGPTRDAMVQASFAEEHRIYEEACQALREMADVFGGLWD